MFGLVLSQVLRRPGRSWAVVAAIVVAAVSFSLLTSAVATSQLQVRGTVKANSRSAYDILVRPPGSRTALESSDRLIQENYLAGIYGGITLAQYHAIERIPGISVAAPIAMIGYLMPFVSVGFPASQYLHGQHDALLRVRVTDGSDNGLSTYPDATQYIYVHGNDSSPPSPSAQSICSNFQVPSAQSAFDLPGFTRLSCYKSASPASFGAGYYYPVLLAAIDPVQEAKLVGLNKAVISGRYLSASDATVTEGLTSHGKLTTPTSPNAVYKFHQVPVLMASRPLTSDSMHFQVQQLRTPSSTQAASRLVGPGALSWLSSLPGKTVHTSTVTDQSLYPRFLKTYANPANNVPAQYWSTGQVKYTTNGNGHLSPSEHPNNNPDIWNTPLQGFTAPQANKDSTFRPLTAHPASNVTTGGVLAAPRIHQVGVFDPNKIEGFSSLSKVPLTTYYPPDASPGDAQTAQILHNKALLPSQNIAGYLQQPPMMLTTIASLHSFTDQKIYGNISQAARAPISVIRVRVADVTGADPTSLARVRLVAAQILRQTGLDVDITMGSSPTPKLIDLPAGKFGRPPLVLSEGWVKKGVAVALLSAIDKKSLTMFGLALLVCLLFLINAAMASVRTRRTELGVLSCLGWPAKRIFALLEVELLVVGLGAGILGSGAAALLAVSLQLDVSWIQVALITPVATLLALLAGIGPAWRACHATPMEAITPPVRAPRRAMRVRSITRLAITGLGRWPGRTILGAASLLVGVAALAALIAIQNAFHGGVVGTSLGNVVAIQVRGVDYLAAGLTILLGAFAVADVAYLNIIERSAEIATLRSTGWRDTHIRRLFATEGVLTATLGATIGAAGSLAIVAVVLPVGVAAALTGALIAAALGIASATIALIFPLVRLNGLAPAAAMVE